MTKSEVVDNKKRSRINCKAKTIPDKERLIKKIVGIPLITHNRKVNKRIFPQDGKINSEE